MNRRSLLGWIGFVAFLWGPFAGDVVLASPTQDAIEKAQQELNAIQGRVEALRSKAEEQRREKLLELQDLERQLEEKKRSSRELREEGEELEAEMRALKDAHESRVQAVDDISLRLKKSIQEFLDRLSGSLAGLEFPAWGEEARRISDSTDSLEQRTQDFLRLLSQEVAASSVASLFRAEILLPSGSLQECDVIRVGMVEGYFQHQGSVGGVYPSTQGDRFRGVAYEKSDHQDSVGSLFEEASKDSNRPEVVDVPIDPSGGLAAYRDLSSRDLGESFEAGGLIMWPLLGLAGFALIIFVERVFYLFIARRRAQKVIDPVRQMSSSGKHEEALEWLAGQRGPAARVLASCLELRNAPPEVVDRGIEESMLAEIPRIERALGLLGTLGAIAPFLGLLGTITGMIKTFNVITASGGNDPTLLSGGISEALITTQAGLVVAIPILLLHTLVSGRVDNLIARIEQGIAGVSATFTGNEESKRQPDLRPAEGEPLSEDGESISRQENEEL